MQRASIGIFAHAIRNYKLFCFANISTQPKLKKKFQKYTDKQNFKLIFQTCFIDISNVYVRESDKIVQTFQQSAQKEQEHNN